MSPRVAAILLAAGASTRMGRPKALLERGGVTFLRALIDLAEGAGCAPRIVVAGAVELPASECRGARVVIHEAWPLGQLSSLQAGLRALAPGAGRGAPTSYAPTSYAPSSYAPTSDAPTSDALTSYAPTSDAPSGALVLTVDRPHLAAATLAALVRAHGESPGAILQPAHRGRRGHPILYPAALFAEVLAIDPEVGPRAWLGSPAIAARRRSIEVEDPAIFDNLDTPADLDRLGRDGR